MLQGFSEIHKNFWVMKIQAMYYGRATQNKRKRKQKKILELDGGGWNTIQLGGWYSIYHFIADEETETQ